MNKIAKIRKETPENNIVAEKVFREVVDRVEDDFIPEKVKIKDVYKIITKAEPSKARGNDELSKYIFKQIPELASICKPI